MFAHARNALRFGLDLSEISSSSAVILPEFTCEALVQPFRNRGNELLFHRVNSDLTPDWHDVDRLMTSRVSLLVMINYFGNSQDVSRYQEYSTRKRVTLVEDSAHGAFGQVMGQPAGTVGNIGITSERKMAGTDTGATLFINGVAVNPPAEWRMSEERKRFWFRDMLLAQRKNTFYGEALTSTLSLRQDFRAFRAHSEPSQPPMRASKGDTCLIQQLARSPRVLERRMKWWAIHRTLLGLSEAHFIFSDLTRGANPWAYPFWADEAASVIAKMRLRKKLGTPIRPWPTLPSEVRNKGFQSRIPISLMFSPLE